MVQKLKGISARLKAARSEMPVMMPGSAIGRMMSSDTVSRPKKRLRATAPAAREPRSMAMRLETAAPRRARTSAAQLSRTSVVEGQRVSVRVDHGGRRIINKKKEQNKQKK